MPEHKRLGKIIQADLGFEDHGIFGVNIVFDYGSAVQGTGWYTIGNEVGGPMLEAIMKAVGVSKWDEMVGKTVHVLFNEENMWSALIAGFEKLPTEKRGGVFVFDDFFQQHGIERKR